MIQPLMPTLVERCTDDQLCAAVQVEGSADVVITMGCGDACPVSPGKHYENWDVADPEQPIEAVRAIRGEIERHVQDLLATVPAEAHHARGAV